VNWISPNSDLMGLTLAAVTIVAAVFVGWLHLRRKQSPFTTTENSPNQSASTSEALTRSVDRFPELTASTFSVALNPAIQKNVFLLHVRNGATSPLATARNVVAHIGYKRRDGHGMCVDYGAWMERGSVTDVEGGQTKNLVVALTDDGRNFAVNWTGLRTNFTDPRLVPVGELTPGRWMMVVTITAEHYEKIFTFLLTVEKNGAIKCDPVKTSLW
jgi:hypothetical protein